MGSKKDEFGEEYGARCYMSHPTLKVRGGKLVGGYARSPAHKDADIYVALDGNTSCLASDPWEKQVVVEVQYPMGDMRAPEDPKRFKKLVTYLCAALKAKKKVHVGCFGGHGRTGTLLAAIIAEANQEKHAIQWVRKHYCERAVESNAQVDFLMEHYGVSQAVGAKEGRHRDFPDLHYTPSAGRLLCGAGGTTFGGGPRTTALAKVAGPEMFGQPSTLTRPEDVPVGATYYKPMASPRSLWKPRS